MKTKLLALLFLVLVSSFILQAQPIADCTINYTATAAGAQSPAFANLFTNSAFNPTRIPCVSWVFSYATDNATAASVQLEGAADAVSGGVHSPTGSYTALTASSASGAGTNPATGPKAGSAFLCCDAYPWLRFNVNTLTPVSGTATITVVGYGYRNMAALAGGGGGGSPSGPAGGDLAGSYPNPTVVNLSNVSNSSLANSGLVNPSTTVNGQTCTLGSSCTITATHSFGATFVNGGSALGAGVNPVYFTVPYSCTIQAWNIEVSPADTATIDIWRIATGTAIPTVANTITASAVPAISTGTAVHSTVLTGWCGTGTCVIAANDIIGINLQAVGGTATFANLTVQCQ